MMSQVDRKVNTRKKDVIIILMIIVDIYLILRLLNPNGFIDIVLSFLLLAIINYIFYIILKKFNKPKQKPTRSVKSLTSLLDGMKISEPLNIELQTMDVEPVVVVEKIEIVPEIILPVGEAAIEILYPKNVIYQKPIYNKPVIPIKYCDEFAPYLFDRGLSVDKNNIREIFACMATSKLIIVNSDNPVISERFIDIFSDYIGAKIFIDENKADLDAFDTLLTPENKLIDCINNAKSNANINHIMVLKAVDLNVIDSSINKIIDYALDPLLPCEIKNVHLNGISELPRNIWFILVPKKDANLSMSEKLAQSAVTLEINAKIIVPKDEVVENGLKLSFEYFTNLLIDGCERFYIDESEWKKIDQIEVYINENSTFFMDNRLFRQLERYTSTFLMFGGDKNEAIDSVLYAKLLRLISTIHIVSSHDNEDNFLSLFEKLFGLENLNKSKSLLKDIKEDYSAQQ